MPQEDIQTRKLVSLSNSNIEWFEHTYGKNASLSWALDLLLSKFKTAHNHTPEEYARLGAEMAVEDIEAETE